ncbi:acyl CoA binding protein-domain-containing protein [Chlamydoabsidia padenii]|nr:acyl CoA binding protein-domain-containing protein [Chlamydoabsidia padenii]
MSSSPRSRFKKALTVVNNIPQDEVGLQPVPTDRLKFYGLYKQATVGECNIPKPSSRKLVDYAKWKAWYRVRNLKPMEAQTMYVNALVELLAEFIHRYPNNQYIAFAEEALHSLESQDSTSSDEEDYYVDSWDDDPTHEPHHFTDDTQLVTSPTVSYFTNPSLISHTTSSTTCIGDEKKQWKHIPEQHLEALQTKVAALTEQMDRFKHELLLPQQQRYVSLVWLLKTMLKHALANTLLASLWFGILWHRQSPIALALVDYCSPLVKRWILKKVVFWKLTV